MGRTFSYSLSNSSEAPGFECGEEEGTSSMAGSGRSSFNPYTVVGEMGFTKLCYCGRDVIVMTSNTATNPGRRFLTCRASNDDDCHVWKWWDVAVTEEFHLAHLRANKMEEKLQAIGKLDDWVKKTNSDIAAMKETFKKGLFFVIGLGLCVLIAYIKYGS